MDGLIKSIFPARFVRLAEELMPPTITHEFLEIFGIAKNMNIKQFHEALEEFLSIMLFQFPALLLL